MWSKTLCMKSSIVHKLMLPNQKAVEKCLVITKVETILLRASHGINDITFSKPHTHTDMAECTV